MYYVLVYMYPVLHPYSAHKSVIKNTIRIRPPNHFDSSLQTPLHTCTYTAPTHTLLNHLLCWHTLFCHGRCVTTFVDVSTTALASHALLRYAPQELLTELTPLWSFVSVNLSSAGSARACIDFISYLKSVAFVKQIVSRWMI